MTIEDIHSLVAADESRTLELKKNTDHVPIIYRQCTDHVKRVILAMNVRYMALNDIMANIGVKHRPTFRERYFKPALEDGAIELLYPDQPKHRGQKYRLTKLALDWKNRAEELQ